MDKSRQQFEAYFINKPQNHIDPLKKDQFGYYYYLVTREAWEAWQASRESLIGTEVSIDLNLPADPYHRIFGSINGFNQSNHELVILIEANEDEVKIKNE
ncbi:TPA: hypothetical protein ACSPKR_000771 [Providencia rettgeri]